jgi:hypothetical protein
LSRSSASGRSRGRSTFRATPCGEFLAAEIDRLRGACSGGLPPAIHALSAEWTDRLAASAGLRKPRRSRLALRSLHAGSARTPRTYARRSTAPGSLASNWTGGFGATVEKTAEQRRTSGQCHIELCLHGSRKRASDQGRVGGYDPTIGIMHEGRDGSSKFVFDLMEPQRPKVDRAVLDSSSAKFSIQPILSFGPTVFAGLIRKWRGWWWRGFRYRRSGARRPGIDVKRCFRTATADDFGTIQVVGSKPGTAGAK